MILGTGGSPELNFLRSPHNKYRWAFFLLPPQVSGVVRIKHLRRNVEACFLGKSDSLRKVFQCFCCASRADCVDTVECGKWELHESGLVWNLPHFLSSCKRHYFSKCLARVLWNFLVYVLPKWARLWNFFTAFPLPYYRILLVPMKMVSRGLPEELSLRGDVCIQKKAWNIL